MRPRAVRARPSFVTRQWPSRLSRSGLWSARSGVESPAFTPARSTTAGASNPTSIGPPVYATTATRRIGRRGVNVIRGDGD